MVREDETNTPAEDSNQSVLIEDDEQEQKAKKVKNVRDVYRIENRNKFLPFACLILIGGFFNNTFQAFIKDNFMTAMNIDASEYNLFVLIPPLPNIILPVFSGQIYTYLGLRKGLFIFTTMVLLGMSICFVSTYSQSLVLMIAGKTIHQIGNEMLCIGQSSMVSVWFDSQTLALAFTWASLAAKLSGSTSGIAYPLLYDVNNDLQIPLMVSILTCVISFVSMLVMVYYDAEADKRLGVYDEPRKKVDMSLKQFTDFKPLFFMYVIQSAFLYGSFYAFESYVHSVLHHKFGIGSTMAGYFTSIPFWMAFTAPVFGYIADKQGRRILGLLCTGVIAVVSVTIMLIMPGTLNMNWTLVPLIAFGFFLSMMAAYLFPTFPLLVRGDQVKQGFGFAYAAKNAGLSVFGQIGGLALGSESDNCNEFLICFICIFVASSLFQLYVLKVDAKAGGNINSKKPKGQDKALLLSAKLSLGASIA